jgi:DNA-binding beta-propeller fold protein YncE
MQETGRPLGGKVLEAGSRMQGAGHTFGRLVVSLWILISCLLLLSGCSVATRGDNVSFEVPILWPLPPEPARIGYVGYVERPEDIGAKKGILQWVSGFLFGKSLDRIIKPYGVIVDDSGRLIVVDTALKGVHVFDRKENKYFFFDKANKRKMVSPISVAVDGTNNIYVSDSEREKIYVFSKGGKFLFEIGEGLNRPVGLAINKDEGLLYVVNTWGHNVAIYNTKGKHIVSFGKRGDQEGGFNFPTNIFVDEKGYVYVTDTLNYRVQIFDKDGKFIKMFGQHGDGSGDFSRARGIAVDRSGHIYVVDALFDTVQIYDKDGRFLLNFGSTGQGRGRFWLPSGIFMDSDDMIYVSDSYNRRVQFFKYISEDIGVIKDEE